MSQRGANNSNFSHRYYEEKGFGVILAARLLNVLALAFTVIFSGFLLLSVKSRALQSECVVAGTCDIADVNTTYLSLPCTTCTLHCMLTALDIRCSLQALPDNNSHVLMCISA